MRNRDNLCAEKDENSEFIEKLGVLWLVRPGQTADATAYCPNCRSALVPFPSTSSKLLVCQTCGFVARGLRPREVRRIASRIRL